MCAGGGGGQRAQRRFFRTAEGGVPEAGRDRQHGAHAAGEAQGERVRHQQGKQRIQHVQATIVGCSLDVCINGVRALLTEVSLCRVSVTVC